MKHSGAVGWARLIVLAVAACGAFCRTGFAQIEAAKILHRTKFIGGPWSQSAFGDWRLDIPGVSVAVADVNTPADRKAKRAPGSLYDAVRTDNPFDEFEALDPVVYAGNETPRPLKLRIVELLESQLSEGARELRFTGEVEGKPELKAIHSLTIAPGNPAIRIITKIVNDSGSIAPNVGMGDVVKWGMLIPFAPRYGVPDPAKVEITITEWVAGRMDDISLGIVATEGQIEARHEKNASQLRYATRSLRPGESIQAERFVMIADRNLFRISDFAIETRGIEFGVARGRVTEMDTKPIPNFPVGMQWYERKQDPRTGDFVSMSAPLPYTLGFTDSDGQYEFRLPTGGDGDAEMLDLTRERSGSRISIPILKDRATTSVLSLSPPTTLRLKVTDAETGELLPCKAQVYAVSNAMPFTFGPPWSAQGARHVYYLPKGQAVLELPVRGIYEVSISRGPEYSVERLSIQVQPNKETVQETALRRIIRTPGWISVDLGVSTNASYDSRTSAKDVAIAAAGEGVEWVVTADANRATDLMPAIREAGLEKWLGATRGIRALPMTREWRADFRVFPVNNAAPDETILKDYVEQAEPGEALKALRRDYPDSLLMVNNPYDDTTGYPRGYDYGLADGKLGKGGFFPGFDLLSVYTPHAPDLFEANMLYYYAETAKGNIYGPAGMSDSKTLFGSEPGYPRVYVRVPNDNPTSTTEKQIVEGIRKGAMAMSNGIFVDAKIEGKGPGELATAKDGRAVLDMSIWAPPYVELNMIDLRKDGIFFFRSFRSASDTPKRFPAEGESGRVEITTKTDTAVTIVVFGGRGVAPTNAVSVFSRQAENFPAYAVVGPIYIDGDGDGKFTPPKPEIN